MSMRTFLIIGAVAFEFLVHTSAAGPLQRPSLPVREVRFEDGQYTVTTHPDFTTTIVVPAEISDLAYDPTFESDYIILRSECRNIVSFSPRRPGVSRSIVILSTKGIIPLTLAAGSFADATYIARLLAPAE